MHPLALRHMHTHALGSFFRLACGVCAKIALNAKPVRSSPRCIVQDQDHGYFLFDPKVVVSDIHVEDVCRPDELKRFGSLELEINWSGFYIAVLIERPHEQVVAVVATEPLCRVPL